MASWPYNTAQWQRLRSLVLASQPLCGWCRELGRVTAATVVDHVQAIREGGEPFDPDNLQALCKPCHSEKTARGPEAGASRTRNHRRGCDADGNPIDPSHPWSKKSLGADAPGPAVHQVLS